MIVPPPWRLAGHGYIIILSPSKKGSDGDPPATRGAAGRMHPIGGPGILMALDYERTDAGAYREVLFVPGYVSVHTKGGVAPHDRQRTADRAGIVIRGHTVSWIIVNTARSRDSGRANWGLPKELGSIDWQEVDRGTRVAVFGADGRKLLRIEISRLTGGMRPLVSALSFPVTARLLPHTLVQLRQELIYTTSVGASGRARPAGKVRIESLSPETAEVEGRRVLAAFEIQRFTLTFPPATKRLHR